HRNAHHCAARKRRPAEHRAADRVRRHPAPEPAAGVGGHYQRGRTLWHDRHGAGRSAHLGDVPDQLTAGGGTPRRERRTTRAASARQPGNAVVRSEWTRVGGAFDREADAEQALDQARALAEAGEAAVEGAAVVTRSASGSVDVPGYEAGAGRRGAGWGTLAGAAVGVLFPPS